MSAKTPAAIDVFALAARDTFARSLGIEIVEASLGRAVSRVKIEDRHVNFYGVAHGGLTYTLADAALGYASNSQGVLSPNIVAHIVYSQPARTGDVLTATAVTPGTVAIRRMASSKKRDRRIGSGYFCSESGTRDRCLASIAATHRRSSSASTCAAGR